MTSCKYSSQQSVKQNPKWKMKRIKENVTFEFHTDINNAFIAYKRYISPEARVEDNRSHNKFTFTIWHGPLKVILYKDNVSFIATCPGLLSHVLLDFWKRVTRAKLVPWVCWDGWEWACWCSGHAHGLTNRAQWTLLFRVLCNNGNSTPALTNWQTCWFSPRYELGIHALTLCFQA